MNIMVVSDDHGRDDFEQAYRLALKEYSVIDAVIHAGDTGRFDNSFYENICGLSFYAVAGNNDFNNNPRILMIPFEGRQILVTHGHRYDVYNGTDRLYYAAMENGADIVIFGHTHVPFHHKDSEVEFLNPGSLAGIRTREKTFAVLTLSDEDTKVKFMYL